MRANYTVVLSFIAFGLVVPRPAAAQSYTVTTLATFNGANGSQPETSLVRDAQGDFFGTTFTGGANGVGTIFELAAGSSTTTTLATFNFATNGAYPRRPA
jgi:uncharacterized repeat protein (TIGR03803 family)